MFYLLCKLCIFGCLQGIGVKFLNSLRSLRTSSPHSPTSTRFTRLVYRLRVRLPVDTPKSIHSYLSPYFWVATGNRTLIESSTSSSVNRYTIGTIIIYRAPTVAYFAALIQFYLYVVRIYPCSAAMSFSLFSEPRTINTTGRSSPL